MWISTMQKSYLYVFEGTAPETLMQNTHSAARNGDLWNEYYEFHVMYKYVNIIRGSTYIFSALLLGPVEIAWVVIDYISSM